MAEILTTVSTISFVLAAFFFALTAGFGVKFRVRSIIGDLTGRTAKKSIQRIRENNEKSGVKSYRPSMTNKGRGKVTAKVGESRKDSDEGRQPETGILKENQAFHVESSQTELMRTEELESTALLDENTEVLDENKSGFPENEISKGYKKKEGIQMKMLEEIILIHTDEAI